MSSNRKWPALVAAVVATGLLAIAGPADAADYRYWTYWTSSGPSWEFSQLGPASTVPKDGSTEGWRFAISSEAASGSSMPRIAPESAFAKFCSGETAGKSQKRVAVVFDFGTSADAPHGQQPPAARGACAVVPTGATGAQVLSRVASVRSGSGLICAIDNYPAKECAAAVKAPDEARSSPEPSRSTSTPKPGRSTPTKKHPAPAKSRPAPSEQETTPTAPQKKTEPTRRPSSTAITPPSPEPTTTKPTSGRTGTDQDSADEAGNRSAGGKAGEEDQGRSDTSSKPSPSPTGSATPTSGSAGPAATQSPIDFADAGAPTAESQNSWWLLVLAAGTILGLAGWGLLRRRNG